MKRLALACLLLLTACQKKDPEGTIQPDQRGGLVVNNVRPGDSAPFRLSGGDTQFIVLNAQRDLDTAIECDPDFELIPYGQQQGKKILTPARLGGVTRMNGVKSGVYFIRTETQVTGCSYTALISKK